MTLANVVYVVYAMVDYSKAVNSLPYQLMESRMQPGPGYPGNYTVKEFLPGHVKAKMSGNQVKTLTQRKKKEKESKSIAGSITKWFYKNKFYKINKVGQPVQYSVSEGYSSVSAKKLHNDRTILFRGNTPFLEKMKDTGYLVGGVSAATAVYVDSIYSRSTIQSADNGNTQIDVMFVIQKLPTPSATYDPVQFAKEIIEDESLNQSDLLKIDFDYNSNPVFRKYFKVVKREKILLSPGQQHVLTVNHKIGKWYYMTEASEGVYTSPGISSFVIVRMRGPIVADSASATQISWGQGKIFVINETTYKGRVGVDTRRLLKFDNNLTDPTTSAQLINPLTGGVEQDIAANEAGV